MSDRRLTVEEYCESLWGWYHLVTEADGFKDDVPALNRVRLLITKSCLLDRTLYGGEKPSETPCPVHQGRWAGIHTRWPGRFHHVLIDYIDHSGVEHKKGEKIPVEVEPMLQEWYDQGCRCYQHKCGCTTGWQPDSACGCRP